MNRRITIMTKLLCLITTVVLFVVVGIAQEERIDVVYLIDGSVIRGTIIEQIPNKSLKIETRDGSTFFIEMSRIQKITKEKPPEASRQVRSGTSDTRLMGGVTMGGLLYDGFTFASGARLGAVISGIAYLGIDVTSTFGEVSAVYFGGDLGFNMNIDKFAAQAYLSIGLGSVAGSSTLCLGPGVSLLYWVSNNVGIGPDGKYMFVPDFGVNFGLIQVTLLYRF
jgi:hypothetical protein